MAVEQHRRAPVLDLSRPTAVDAEFDVAEAAEVLMSVCVLAHRADHDTFDLGAEWLKARLETVPADLVAAAEELTLGSGKVAAHLLGIVLETPKPRTFAAFLERLEATDPLEIKLHLFGRYSGPSPHLPSPEVIERAARGDAAAKEAFLAPLLEYSDKYESVRALLDLDHDELKSRLVNLLPRWYEHVFLPTEREWREAAERDVEAKRALASSQSPAQLAELATRGYQYSPGPDIRTLVFFPSWWMRPWVILWEHKGAKIFCYPIAGDRDADTGSPAELARVYKALGDEGRLRLLRRLSDGPVTLGEAAAELGLTKSTAHHHLAILRHAGFVNIRDEEENVYSLRRDLLPRAGELLSAYLGSSRSSATKP
jgi:DNA-binding transcriptional ArsR family regulator